MEVDHKTIGIEAPELSLKDMSPMRPSSALENVEVEDESRPVSRIDDEPEVSLEDAKRLAGDQHHLLAHWQDLSNQHRRILMDQLKSIDMIEVQRWFEESSRPYVPSSDNLAPIPDERHIVKKDVPAETMKGYWKKGLEAIADGQVAAIVLAGGQASRLGSNVPKGTMNLGIECAFGDSLLGIQAAKIQLLNVLAGKEYPDRNGKIHWVIMTSKGTHDATVKHVEKLCVMHSFDPSHITFICQDEIPAYNIEGKLMIGENKHTIVSAPNGNGGLFPAMYGQLERLSSLGVLHMHVYCVDNILCKVADPHFIGFAAEKEADVATKTVEKKAGELVGSVCLDNDKPCVVEYSELGAELAERKTEDGRFLFGAGSIANHYFSMEFMKKVCSPQPRLSFHRAHKKIVHMDPTSGEVVRPTKPNAIKLEQFVFDVFAHAINFYTWEVERRDEFSPLKNADSTGVDCLSTCSRDLHELNVRWLEAAGISVEMTDDSPLVFLRTLDSYDGEGLDNYRHSKATPKKTSVAHSVVEEKKNEDNFGKAEMNQETEKTSEASH